MFDIQFKDFVLPPFSIQPSEIIHIDDYEIFDIPQWPTLSTFAPLSSSQQLDYEYTIELSWECYTLFKTTTSDWFMQPAISQMFYNSIIQVKQIEFSILSDQFAANTLSFTASFQKIKEVNFFLSSALLFLTCQAPPKFKSTNSQIIPQTCKAISILLEKQDFRNNPPETNKKIAFNLTLAIKNLNKILTVLYVLFF